MSRISFELDAECPHTRARAGILHTPHGTLGGDAGHGHSKPRMTRMPASKRMPM